MKFMNAFMCCLAGLTSLLGAAVPARAQALVPYYQPVPPPITQPKYRLGVLMRNVVYLEPGFGWIAGVQVARVDSGSPAQRAGIEPGDIITRVGGLRTTQYVQVQSLLDQSGGTVILRLKDWRTGRYVDTPPIVLDSAKPVPRSDPPLPPEEDLPEAPESTLSP
ncbi:MAG: PDZ domain-containing protein [Isosphaeraceae bacterium]|nr:PDZ domain-containing protein [Isosphaeraceae bacterium]